MDIQGKVLVVDDEPDIRELLKLTLSRMKIDSVVCADLSEAYEALDKDEFFLCLSDMRLPDGDGINLVKHIQQHKPELPIAIITAYGNVEAAVSSLKAGAFDYVSKPINLVMLKALVNTAYKLEDKENIVDVEDSLIGKSNIIINLREKINKFARSQAPLFIHGESGVGKELVAQLVHKSGPRTDKAFIPVNCGAIPSELMESEFFGHLKGSFTGAVSNHIGLFQAANGGTLFLDEIAELPLLMQVKLLRAIQEKAIKPVGSHTEVHVDVRILSASNKNLRAEVDAENFREDLYYRINVIEILVPSLKEHIEDIPLLTTYILKKMTGMTSPPSVTEAAMGLLKQYTYPGNVRELENILERALALSENDTINESHLKLPEIENIPEQPNTESSQKLDDVLDTKQREVILKALDETNWNRTKAAKLLGISLRTLRYRIKKLELE